jgi:8-oxo-dGTP pyrophosphatase MutT (NUDIX family)
LIDAVIQAWSGIAQDDLRSVLRAVDRPVPPQFVGLYLGEKRIGRLAPEHVAPLLDRLPQCQLSERGVVWLGAERSSVQERSTQLAGAAQALRQAGWITGWRDELYSYWGEIEHAPDPAEPHAFALERAAFRFFGLRSHAVHINGFAPDGRVWCGIRSMSKATDPGRIDNLAAGGLSAGESVLDCAIRELHEEAGLDPELARQVQPAGRVVTRRRESQGWHDEALLVYNLLLPAGTMPRNLDGEVSGFLCLSPEQAMARLGEMTDDAAGVLAQGVLALRGAGAARG